MNKNLELKIVLTFFGILIIVGVIIFNDFGISWDEPISRANGFFALEYLYSILGFDFNFEYPNFFSNQKQNFKEYNDNFYGVVFDLPMGFIEYLFNIESSRQYFLLRHFFTYFLFLTGAFYFFLTLRKFYNFEISLIGLSFLHPEYLQNPFIIIKISYFYHYFQSQIIMELSFLKIEI